MGTGLWLVLHQAQILVACLVLPIRHKSRKSWCYPLPLGLTHLKVASRCVFPRTWVVVQCRILCGSTNLEWFLVTWSWFFLPVRWFPSMSRTQGWHLPSSCYPQYCARFTHLGPPIPCENQSFMLSKKKIPQVGIFARKLLKTKWSVYMRLWLHIFVIFYPLMNTLQWMSLQYVWKFFPALAARIRIISEWYLSVVFRTLIWSALPPMTRAYHTMGFVNGKKC